MGETNSSSVAHGGYDISPCTNEYHIYATALCFKCIIIVVLKRADGLNHYFIVYQAIALYNRETLNI
jgi:hypothetical protein